MNDKRRSSVPSALWRLASESRATHSVAVANATRWPARQARIETAIARWLFPVPGGPKRTTLSLACRKSSWPRCSTTWRRTERWKVKSNSSNADVDTAADQQRVQRGVVAVKAQVGIGGDTRDETAIGVGQVRGQRAHPLALFGRGAGRRPRASCG